MARAKKWLGIVAGLALPAVGVGGADVLAAMPPAAGHSADVVVCQQLPHARASSALNEGLDRYSKGDYEGAADCFRQAQAGFNDLLPVQQKELTDFIDLNNKALRRRAEAADLVRQAEIAEREARGIAAADLAGKALGNQFASPTDKLKAQQIIGRVRGTPPAVAAPSVVAKGKLAEARELFANGNLDAAEQLAREAKSAGAGAGPGESSPDVLLQEITHTRQDATALLTLARQAFVRGDLDRAEALAKASRKVEPIYSTHLWGDSPSKVLDDVATARKKATEKPPIKMVTELKPSDTPPVIAAQGMAPVKKPDPLPPPPDEKKATQTVEQAQQLLKQGRQALRDGQLDKAEECGRKADALKPNLGWWADETPAKLLADVQAARSARAATTKPVGDPKTPAADPRALLRQAHEAFDAGKLDEALGLAQKAKSAPGSKDAWGLLDFDTPDKLISEINKSRTKRNQEEAAKLLVEGRKLLEQARQDEPHRGELLDSAQKLALKADSLRNGNYSVWEMGDRPSKLLDDITNLRKEGRTKVVPPVPPLGGAVVDNTGAGRVPTASPDDGAVKRARQMMNDARAAARAGDTSTAYRLIATVESMNLPADKLGSDNPAAVRRELTAAAVAGVPVKPTDDANVQRAHRLMNDARIAARAGRTADAINLIVMVEGMNLPADKLGSDSPALVRRELASLTTARPPVAEGPRPPVSEGPPPLLDRTGNGEARLLVTEARRLQRENKFLEARARLLQAQSVRAVFGPDEDTPEKALLDVAGSARRYIDRLETQADDDARRGDRDPQLYVEAEKLLSQAQTLARGFQLDTNLLDRKLAWVQQQTRGGTAIARVGDFRANATDGGPQGDGQKLITQAELEIRAGNLGAARRLVDQVYAGNYGLKVEAEKLLRSIDVEEYVQKCKEQRRTFDAGLSAFKRGDMLMASRILHTIEVAKLDPDRQAKMRELMTLPDLQPDRFEQVVKTGATSPDGPQHVSDMPPGDSREADYLKQVESLQNVKFQKMRDQELKVEIDARKAIERGETERAVEVLQEYLSELPQSGLDPEKMALVRRPVEAKLQQYRTLDAQKKIDQAAGQAVTQAKDRHNQTVLAQVNKEQKIKELIDKFNTLYKQAKYHEAEMYAMQAQELDPDNPIAAAAIQLARTQWNRARYKEVKDKAEDTFVKSLDDSQDMGPYVDMRGPVGYENGMMNTIRRHSPLGKVIGPPKTEKDREIERRLETPVSLNFNNMSLGQAMDYLANDQNFNVLIDTAALAQKGIDPRDTLSFKVDNMTLKSALKNMLRSMHLTYIVADEALQITTPEAARGKQVRRAFAVAELVIPVPDGTPTEMLPRIGQPPQNPLAGMQSANSTPYTGPMTMSGGTPTGSAANPFASGAAPPSGGGWDGKKGANATREDELIRLIQNTIEPGSWSSLGGPGTIDYFPMTMTLVINQTSDIQEQIADLLAALRRLQDAEVAVEIRLISIAEGFYERIGVDFNVNIVNDKGTQKFQPMITSGQFKPAGFINDFTPDKFLSGLTPAGTFTSDLGIPIRNSSFGMAIPPFGGFPNVPGGNGGIELGLAFLSDIQVFMFLEAAQGDQRTNVMQAPKLTMFNGQNATLTVADQQSFVTSGSVTVVNGQPVFTPQTQQFQTGAQISVQPVISADRRFVRMNFSGVGGGITLTNLASAVVPLFPIVQLVPTVLDGGVTSQPVAFTQFFQQPVFNSVSVVTTVMVPDGGTVLLGGLKRLSEGRNEFGPPVLSKIPYLDRLFRNVGYGREVENLMMMVTPRIIINEEEEFRQTGVEREREANP